MEPDGIEPTTSCLQRVGVVLRRTALRSSSQRQRDFSATSTVVYCAPLGSAISTAVSTTLPESRSWTLLLSKSATRASADLQLGGTDDETEPVGSPSESRI
jgi:hypothetical protein